MKILEIYKEYQIMPQLQEHMLRVAGVADLIISNIPNPSTFAPNFIKISSGKKATADKSSLILDREDVVKACLLHDMGNIVKFDFEYTKQFMSDLTNLDVWQQVQKEFSKKYGSSSHEATGNIIKEIGISERVLELVDCVGFHQGPDNAATSDFAKKICAYSDMRAEPYGVVSLEERFKGLRDRYRQHPEGAKNRVVFENSLREIEKQIFEHCKIKPEDITDESIKGNLEILRNYEIYPAPIPV